MTTREVMASRLYDWYMGLMFKDWTPWSDIDESLRRSYRKHINSITRTEE